MAVQLNHTIVASRDAELSSTWWAEVLGLDPPVHAGHFWQVSAANGIDLDFDSNGPDATIPSGHFAFLISEDEFDEIFARIVERDVDYFGDPAGRQRGAINHHFGGRGVYFPDPDGHWMEIITQPYG